MGRIGTISNSFGSSYPKRPSMGQIGPQDIGADLAFGADLALSILQCTPIGGLALLLHSIFTGCR